MNAMNLLDWAEDYFRHRDLILSQIESIVKEKDHLIIRQNDGIQKKVCVIDNLAGLKTGNHVDINNIFLPNTKENLKHLISNWSKFSAKKNISFYFVNPNSVTDKLWIISPFIHSKICDESNVEKSLKTLFSSVSEVK